MGKGDRREREAVQLYQRAGFATYRPATVQYGENDVFGLFDLLAVSPSHRHVRGVQVKSNRAVGIEAWMRHTRLWRRLGWHTDFAVAVDNQGWRLATTPIRSDGIYHWAVDERELDCSMGDGVVEYLEACDV